MKRALIIATVILLWCFVGWKVHDNIVHAQGPTAATFSGIGPHTTCQTPVTGAYYLCVATDGIWVSNNGAAYFQILPPAAATAGVTSISVNAGTPMTGPVALTIPSKATSTATVPGASFSQNGALTLTAPTVTTTIQ